MHARLILLLYLVVVTSAIFGQSPDIVASNGITSKLHQKNVGKIIFTSRAVPLSELNASHFLNNYELTNKSNLYISVFLNNSMTNYLHRLAPALSADSLVKVGNYQFSFYVDDALVYQTNLWPGAPRPAQQHTETVWSKPLIDAGSSWWSQSAWNRFMLNGGKQALTEGRHILKLELKPYIIDSLLTTGDIIASGQIELMVNLKPQIILDKIKLSPIEPSSDFEISKEKFNRNLIKRLKGNIDEEVFKRITSVVVVKNGKLLVEEYFNKAGRDSLHDVRSVSK